MSRDPTLLDTNVLIDTLYKDSDHYPATVLDAERRLLEEQERLAQNETATAIALVAVYKALGGGWEMASPDAKAASLQ
jgi:hypothetical protein